MIVLFFMIPSVDGCCPDLGEGGYEFDPQRKHWYCLCEELIDGLWEGLISISLTNPNKKHFKTKTNNQS